MAVDKTKILGINDLKLILIDEDYAAVGATPGKFRVSATGGVRDIIDLPGVQSLALTPTFVEKELRGDEVVLDKYTKLDSIGWSFTNAIMSLPALQALLGGSLAGTTNKVFTLTGLDLPKFFVLEGQAEYTDEAGGDIHIRLYKCKANKVDYELKGEDYAMVNVSGIAIPTQYIFPIEGTSPVEYENGGRIKEVKINDAKSAIDFSDLSIT